MRSAPPPSDDERKRIVKAWLEAKLVHGPVPIYRIEQEALDPELGFTVWDLDFAEAELGLKRKLRDGVAYFVREGMEGHDWPEPSEPPSAPYVFPPRRKPPGSVH